MLKQIPYYGICLLLSLVVGMIIILKESYKIVKEKDKRFILVIYILMGAFFGGKYFTLLSNLDKMNENVNFETIGLSSYGGLIGILILMCIYSKQMKINLPKMLTIAIKPIPLMYAIGKIGCSIAGCCHGIEYSGILSIHYSNSQVAPNGIGFFPIQIIETIVFTIIFIYIEVYSKKKKDDNILPITLILCGAAKFILDFLRISHVDQFISLNQIVSVIFIIIGIAIIIKKKRKDFV